MDITSKLVLAVSAMILIYFIQFLIPLINMRRKGKDVLKDVDGFKPHWLLGHVHVRQPTAKGMQWLVKATSIYPKMMTFWLGPFKWFLTLYHPDVVPTILATDEPKDETAYGCIKPWIGDGLLVSSGKKWHRNRHLLTKAFHFDILKSHTRLFNSCATVMLNKWAKKADGRTVEISEDVNLMTLDSLTQCIMSHQTHCQEERSENKYVSAIRAIGKIVLARIYNPLLYNEFIFYLTPIGRKFKRLSKYIHDVDEKLIQERRTAINAVVEKINNAANGDIEDDNLQLYRKITGKHLDFLDILLLTKDEDGKGLTDLEIRHEVDTFSLAGSDTTASGLSWAFYCLAAYPELQTKCREEILEVLEDKTEIKWDDLRHLTYLTMFIKEVLRMYPPVYGVARTTTRPLTFARGFGKDQYCLKDKISASNAECSHTIGYPASIDINIYALHHHPSVWENPEVFDPQRFSVENIKTRSPYAYLPFSAGPRNCIGKNFAMAELKVLLAKALQRFSFYIDDDCPRPTILPEITLKADGIYLKMKEIC